MVLSRHTVATHLTSRIQLITSALLVLLVCFPALAQRATTATNERTPGTLADPLDQFNASVEVLVKKVWPSVVQVLVTSYGPREESERGNTNVVIGRQRSVASGFVIDPDGYIMTNAHVVNGAQRIQIVIPPSDADGSLTFALSGKTKTVPARLLGISSE